MLMPDEMYEIIWNALDAEVKKTKYAKVIMKLQEVLEGDFFTEYIKKGMPGFTYEYCLTTLPLRFDDMIVLLHLLFVAQQVLSISTP